MTKTWTKDMALRYMYKWCAQQERCHHDIRYRLIKHKVYGDDLEDIIVSLISEGFLNEERYSIAYAMGKHRINKWGKNKIIAGLKQKNIGQYNIKTALSSIDQEEYIATIRRLIEKKVTLIKAGNTYELKNKMIKYLMQKGYAYDEISELVTEIIMG